MDPDAQARMVYLVLLGAFLVLMLFRGGRLALGRLLRTLILWALIIGGLALAYSIFVEEAPPDVSVAMSGETIVLNRAADGHFHAMAEVNGHPVRFIVDTGATEIVLARGDAADAGLDPAELTYLGRAQTAGGTVRTAPVSLDTLGLGERVDTGVRATVSDGDMPISLLGMAYLDRFERIEIAGDEMRLVP